MELTKEAVIQLLETNDKAIGRALLVLLSNQTADEQVAQTVKHNNGKGFTPGHARMGTSMAQFFQEKGFLSTKQAAYWRQTDVKGRMRIGIYTRQLIEAAELKLAKATRLV